eukprot:9489365-Pyramimonas_sp.AAC.2
MNSSTERASFAYGGSTKKGTGGEGGDVRGRGQREGGGRQATRGARERAGMGSAGGGGGGGGGEYEEELQLQQPQE